MRPWVTISVRTIPNDHTSDLTLNLLKIAASGAVHLIGNLVPIFLKSSKLRIDFIKCEYI